MLTQPCFQGPGEFDIPESTTKHVLSSLLFSRDMPCSSQYFNQRHTCQKRLTQISSLLFLRSKQWVNLVNNETPIPSSQCGAHCTLPPPAAPLYRTEHLMQAFQLYTLVFRPEATAFSTAPSSCFSVCTH